MKKTLLLLVLLCSLSLSAMAQTKWVDATTLNICGHTLRNAENPYSRFDSKPFGYTNKIMIRYATYSTGMYVMFSPFSSTILASGILFLSFDSIIIISLRPVASSDSVLNVTPSITLANSTRPPISDTITALNGSHSQI